MASVSSARPVAAGAARRGALPQLPDLLSVLLLLAVLAPAGIVFSQLSFWNRFVPPWPAFLAGAICCGLASLSRRPIWWLLAAYTAGLLAATIALYHTLPGPTLALRDEQLRTHLRLWVEQLRGGEQVYDDLAVVLWSSLAAWAAGMWAAWAALRAHWHWLVLAAAGALLASSIGQLPHWPAVGLAVYVFASLLFLARLNHRRLVAGAASRGDTYQTGGARAWTAYLVAVGAGALGLVAVGWLTPAAHWRTSLYHQPTASLPSGGFQFFAASRGQSVLHDFGSSMTFSGAISLGDTPVASVEAATPGYLFGVAYDHYNGSGWLSTAIDQPRRQASRLEPAAITEPGRGRLDLRLNGDAAYQDSEPVDLTVHAEQAASVLLTAGPPVGLAEARGGQTGSGGLSPSALELITPKALNGTPSSELTELSSVKPVPTGSSYSSSGLVSRAAPDSLRGAGSQLPDWVKNDYLQLPRQLPERVRRLAADLTRRSGNDYDRVLAIQSYLRRMPYDQNIPAPPPGEDGVDYLLFVTQRGYCDYFASALAVMLRSVGVPARVVAGYVMHESASGGRYQVRERDAHAWTEVFFPDYGWQRFDATPGGAASYVSNPQTSAAAGTSSPLTGSPPIPGQSLGTTDPAASTAHRVARTASGALGGAVSWAILWFGFLMFGLLVVLYLWLRSQRDGRRAAISAWRWTAFAGRMLVRRQASHETPAEYAAALSQTTSPSSLRELAKLYGRARYARPQAEMPPPSQAWRRFGAAVAGLARRRIHRR